MYSIIENCENVQRFSHSNVLPFIGICTNIGVSVHIVMPYIVQGSLLNFLQRERSNFLISELNDERDDIQQNLLLMCLQVARGMEYLMVQQFLHCNLAARNCL